MTSRLDRRRFLTTTAALTGTLCVGACKDGKDDALEEMLELDGDSRTMAGPGDPGGPQPEPPNNDGAGDPGMRGMGPGNDGMPGTAGAGGAGGNGGAFNIPEEECVDPDVGGGGGNELVIDMNTGFYGTTAREGEAATPFAGITPPVAPGPADCDQDLAACLDRDAYEADIYLNSDTSLAVLSGEAHAIGGSPGPVTLTNEEVIGAADNVAANYPGRILSAASVMPNDRIDMQLQNMELLASSVHAWRLDPSWAPDGGSGYWLDQGVGPMTVQKGIDLNRPIFLVSKGASCSNPAAVHSHPRDLGPVARMFPDAHFVVLGSGYGAGGSTAEGPYEDASAVATGVDGLIRSLRDAGIGPNGRDLDDPTGPPKVGVYADCSGAWPALAFDRDEEAMHYWGKLLLHLGEDRILWGTGAAFLGNPQHYIEAFRSFQIAPELQESHGYPELTQAIKEKILGQNAARLLSIHPDVDLSNSCHSDLTAARLTRRSLLRLA